MKCGGKLRKTEQGKGEAGYGMRRIATARLCRERRGQSEENRDIAVALNSDELPWRGKPERGIAVA